MSETALHQVLGCKAGNGFVIGAYRGQMEVRQQKTKIDDRQPEFADSLRHRAIFDSRDHAVTFPVLQPTRADIAQAAFLEEDGPGSMLANIPGNAHEQPASECPRRFN